MYQSTKPSATDDAPCELMPWDTAFFGIGVAKVRGDTLDDARCAAIDAWCAANDVRWLNLTARADERPTIEVAERNGFHLADVRMTYQRYVGPKYPLPVKGAPNLVRPAAAADVPGLRRIAAASHTDSRFYHDEHLTTEACGALFAAWIQNSFDGFANSVLVTGPVGEPSGYVTCHVGPERGGGHLGLLAVDRHAQGRGLVQALAVASIDYLVSQGVERATLVTQGRNIVAQRIYQKLGFLLRRVELQYHKWYRPQDAVSGIAKAQRPR